jgi:PAS domain S-box-containing protein
MSTELNEGPGELQALNVVGSEGDEATLGTAVAEPVVRHLLDTVPVHIWWKKPDGEPCYVNQRVVAYTGRTLKQLVDLGWKDLIHPEDEEKFVGALSHTVQSGGCFQLKLRLRRADGRHRWFLVQAAPLLDSQGRVTRLFGMSTQLAFPPLSYEAQVAWGSGKNATEADPIRPSGVSLSERERTIVIMMGQGLCNKRIARQLSISPETVKWHAKNIFWKLNAQTRAQAVYRASTLGIIVKTEAREQGPNDLIPAAAMRR